MGVRAIGRSSRDPLLVLGLFVVFLTFFCSCSDGGGGSSDSQTDGAPRLIDVVVSVNWLDRVYDDDERYYALDVVTGDASATVSETDSWTPSEYFNGVWTSTHTWKFDATIEVPETPGEFYFVLYKIVAGVEADAWESDVFSLQQDPTDYTIELNADFNPNYYHIEGGISHYNAGLNDVTVTLSGDLNSSQNTVSGRFSFDGIPNGDYLVTPEKDGYVFEPPLQPVVINNASEMEINFIATSK